MKLMYQHAYAPIPHTHNLLFIKQKKGVYFDEKSTINLYTSYTVL